MSRLSQVVVYALPLRLTMARSACIHPSHRETVSLALERNGFLTQGSLAVHLEMALSTVNNFCRGVKVSVAKFEEICETLGLEARMMVLPADAVSLRTDGAQPSSPQSTQVQSLQDREAITPPTQPQALNTPTPTGSDTASSAEPNSFFSYDAAWVGREGVTQALAERLQEDGRFVLILGIAGVGKTALAERLVLALQARQRLIRVNFDHQDQTTDFGSIAARILEQSGQAVGPDARKDVQQLRQRLFRYLQETEHLIVIDSLEDVLTGDDQGESRFNDGEYLVFFQQVLAAESFQSRFIITSQEMPAELVRFGTRYQPLWHKHLLTGLSESEQLDLFETLGFDLATTDRTYLTRIGHAYEGHPLALRVITGEIGSRPFFGNVQAYWNRYGAEIEEVERSLAEAAEGSVTGAEDKWALDRFTRALRRNVRQRLEQTFDRLRRDARSAYLLLCEASVYRCPVPEDWWLSHLDYWDVDSAAQLVAMDTLRDRFLVEEIVNQDEYQLKQHNLIRSVALDHLKQLSFD